ncbi:MAG: tRNA guanosine(34) transglycosylase Tgt [Myxococcota bacterium]
MNGTLETAHGPIRLPAFLPDATRGTIRTVPTHLLASAGVEVLMTNAFHLAERPGTDAVRSAGGVHAFMGWSGPIATDSGGFQVWSLLRDRPDHGAVTDDGFAWRGEDKQRRVLTPEKALQHQLRLGADVVFCLDQCTHPDDPPEVQRASVDRTLAWARRTKAALEQRPAGKRPRLYGVVQGGRDPDLRRRCAEGLIEIGFDGYGFGGWPIDDDGALVDAVGLVAELLPPDVPRHALGIGRPDTLLAAWRAGYDTFDATAPTREARRGLLYVPRVDLADPAAVAGAEKLSAWYDATNARNWRDARPVDETCDCPLCRGYSRALLAHLMRAEEPAGQALASLHNLRFVTRVVEALRGAAR